MSGPIRESDVVEITILMDNYTDRLMLQGNAVTRRPQVPPPPGSFLAEHGLSCLVQVRTGSDQQCIMMDAGITSECLIHNARLLGVDFSTIRGFVLSHGHFDHFGGLPGFLKIRGGNTPVYLHPEAFLERRVKFPPPYKPASMPHLDAEELKKSGGVIHQSRTMSLLASDCILATGEIVRIIPFEKGFPSAEAKIGGNWIADPFHDDQGLVVSVKNKGLVVISGCAHAGIINTVEHAKRLTGKEKVHAVLGGFHLTGAHFDPIIQPTIDEMKRIDPDYIIPMHCTGWKAINQFAQEMPEQFILNTVGTTYVFGES